jgi:hypothetical protein
MRGYSGPRIRQHRSARTACESPWAIARLNRRRASVGSDRSAMKAARFDAAARPSLDASSKRLRALLGSRLARRHPKLYIAVLSPSAAALSYQCSAVDGSTTASIHPRLTIARVSPASAALSNHSVLPQYRCVSSDYPGRSSPECHPPQPPPPNCAVRLQRRSWQRGPVMPTWASLAFARFYDRQVSRRAEGPRRNDSSALTNPEDLSCYGRAPIESSLFVKRRDGRFCVWSEVPPGERSACSS